MPWSLLFLAASCGPATPLTPCHFALDGWCFHQESERGPVPPEPGATCPEEAFAPGPGAWRCGDRWDVSSASGGFTGSVRYYDAATGELVGVEYWTDTNSYCGGFDFWYGREISCEPTCMWDEAEAEAAGLPVCDT